MRLEMSMADSEGCDGFCMLAAGSKMRLPGTPSPRCQSKYLIVEVALGRRLVRT